MSADVSLSQLTQPTNKQPNPTPREHEQIHNIDGTKNGTSPPWAWARAQLFAKFEEDSFKQISAEIEQAKHVPAEVFQFALKAIYKRSV